MFSRNALCAFVHTAEKIRCSLNIASRAIDGVNIASYVARPIEETAVADDMSLELRKLLDQYDDKCRAAERRKQQVITDHDNFLKEFAELRQVVVRPVFEAAGAILKERGHDFRITEEEYAVVPGGKATEAGIAIQIMPAGVERTSDASAPFPSLSFITRHYNKTVDIRGCSAPRKSGDPAGPRGDYQLAQINTGLVEKELLDLIGEIAG